MLKIFLTVLLISVSFSSWAKGPANKVTGDFLRLSDTSATEYECEFTAHEAKDNRISKGSMYCSKVGVDNTWEIMLHNGYSCVNVFADGTANIGGKVTSVTPANNHLLGKFVGFTVVDGGEPAYLVDSSVHGIWPDSVTGKTDFDAWCADGVFFGTSTYSYTVQEGNIQVHYYDK